MSSVEPHSQVTIAADKSSRPRVVAGLVGTSRVVRVSSLGWLERLASVGMWVRDTGAGMRVYRCAALGLGHAGSQ